MKRLVAFLVGSTLVFFAILSVFNLALALEAVQFAEAGLAGLNGSFFLDDFHARLWAAYGWIGILFLAHFVTSAVIAGVYWFCWRPARPKTSTTETGELKPEPTAPETPTFSVFGATSRTLSPFFADLFALVVLSPVLNNIIGRSFGELRVFLEDRIARPLSAIAMEQHDEGESAPQDPNAFLKEYPAETGASADEEKDKIHDAEVKDDSICRFATTVEICHGNNKKRGER